MPLCGDTRIQLITDCYYFKAILSSVYAVVLLHTFPIWSTLMTLRPRTDGIVPIFTHKEMDIHEG